jgi:Flp pilus assembly protein TadG
MSASGKKPNWMRRLAAMRRGAADRQGTAAVEFAMLLPIMITLFFGTVETSMALLARADVSLMASTTADLISQASQIQTADISNAYNAAGTILYPYYDPSKTGSAKPTIRITSVIYDTATASTTSGKIAWTCIQTGSGSLTPGTRAVGDTVTFGPPLIPASQDLMTTGGSVLIAEIAYSYASPTSKVITGTMNFTNNFVTKPRRVPQIAPPAGNCPP